MTRTSAANLLHMLSPLPAHTPDFEAPDLDWDEIVSLAVAHRVAPQLYRRCQQAMGLEPPQLALERLRRAHEASVRRSFTLVRNILRVNDVLSAAEIPWAALKGAFLGLHAYPEAALRPVRDLDILVDRERAADAAQLLLSGGFERLPGDTRSLGVALEQGRGRHLPGLIEPATGMVIELHTRLSDAGDGVAIREFSRRALADTKLYEVLGKKIPFLTPHNNALHLIIHAALDHTFDNGPLTLTDIAYLSRLPDFDGDAFWSEVRHLNFERASAVVLKLTERFQGPLGSGIGVAVSQVPSEILDGAARLILGDYERRSTVGFRASLDASSTIGWLAVIAGRAFPSGLALQMFAGPHRSRWPLPAIYCLWALSRTMRLARSYRSSSLNSQAQAAASIQSWMHSAPRSAA